MRTLTALLLVVAGPLWGQSLGVTEDDGSQPPDLSGTETIDGSITVETLEVGRSEAITLTPRRAPAMPTSTAAGAILRGLDKVSGAVTDFDMRLGDAANLGNLTIELTDCRFPSDNPSGDAFALVKVSAEGLENAAFEGWMVASSPALSALDHPRYDVWVIRCRTS